MSGNSDDHYGTITTVGGLRMPNVRFRWLPLTYTNFFGNSRVVQAIRSFDSADGAMKMLQYTLKHQRRRMRELGVDPDISKRFGYLYFRGQTCVEWSVMPTIYRDLPENEGERDTAMADRVAKTAEFLMRAKADPLVQRQVPDMGKKSIEQQRAIARHFGMSNEYIDLTLDPRVAMFFATKDARTCLRETTTGVVYMLNLELLFQVFRWEQHFDADGTVLLLSPSGGTLEIPYLSISDSNQVVQTTLQLRIKGTDAPLFAFRWLNPTGIHRIEVQKATFLRVGAIPDGLFDEHTLNWLGSPQVWQLFDFLTFKFVFPQSRVYRRLLRGIFGRHLLPPGERLQAIADDIVNRETGDGWL